MNALEGLIGGVLGAAGDAAASTLRWVAGVLVQALTVMMKLVGTWWMSIPPPQLEVDDGQSVAEQITTSLHSVTMLVGVLSLVIALPRVAISMKQEAVLDVVWGFLRFILVSAIGLASLMLLLDFGDKLAPWLVKALSGATFEEGFGQLTGSAAAIVGSISLGGLSILILLLPIVAIGGLINMVFVFFSYGMVVVVGGVLPTLAADTFSEKGRKRFEKVVGWLIALVLFKPVAAVIYGAGIAMMRGIGVSSTVPDADQASRTLIQMIFGVVIVGAAAIALPALLRVVVPAVAAGPRGIGAGHVVMAAVMATGAMKLGSAATAPSGAGKAPQGGGGPAGTAGGQGGQGATGNTGTAGASSSPTGGSGSSPAGGSGSGGSGSGPSADGASAPSGSGSGGSGGSGSGASGQPAAAPQGAPAGSGSGGSGGSGSGGSGSGGSAQPAAAPAGGGPGSGGGSGTQPQPAGAGASGGGSAAAGTGAGGLAGRASGAGRSGDRLRSAGHHLRQQATGAGESIDSAEGDD